MNRFLAGASTGPTVGGAGSGVFVRPLNSVSYPVAVQRDRIELLPIHLFHCHVGEVRVFNLIQFVFSINMGRASARVRVCI